MSYREAFLTALENPPPAVVELGAPQRVHPAAPFHTTEGGRFTIVGGVACLLLGVGMTIFSILQSHPWPLFAIAFGVQLLGGGLVAAAFLMRSSQPASYAICAEGLARWDTTAWDAVAWEDVDELLSPQGFRDEYRLLAVDGEEIPIGRWVEKYDELIAAVYDQVAAVRIPRAHAALASGVAAEFGPIGLTRDAIHYNGKKLPWERVKSVTILIVNGAMSLKIVDRQALVLPWCDVPLNRIPSEGAFLEVLKATCPPRLLVEDNA